MSSPYKQHTHSLLVKQIL